MGIYEPMTVQEVRQVAAHVPCVLPFARWVVRAGFPSPAEDWIEGELDLSTLVIKNRVSTYFVRAVGDSMVGAGIQSGDLLVVDRSLEPHDGSIVIASVDAELTVKRYRRRGGRPLLVAENPAYPSIAIQELSDFSIWGVVTTVVHSVR